MKRLLTLLMCLLLPAAMTACTASADERTGEAQGYGGILRVTVTLNGSDITDVTVTEHHETEGVGTRAIDALPDAIAQKDSVEVDSVSGATVTSEAIRAAVRNAMGLPEGVQETIPMPGGDDRTGIAEGVGMAATGRVGPGKDENGNQVYSFNVVFAAGSFDSEGRIRSVKVDQLEVASPNIGEGGTVFSGFPAEEAGVDAFLGEVSAWKTKGAKGDAYMLTSGSWREEMNAYEQHFTGKTVDEVEAWFGRLFDPETGRPFTSGAGYDALSEEDRRAAMDVTSSATMSLRGEYGDILLALRRAWEDAKRSMADTQPAAPAENADPAEGTLVDTNTDLNLEGQAAG